MKHLLTLLQITRQDHFLELIRSIAISIFNNSRVSFVMLFISFVLLAIFYTAVSVVFILMRYHTKYNVF